MAPQMRQTDGGQLTELGLEASSARSDSAQSAKRASVLIPAICAGFADTVDCEHDADCCDYSWCTMVEEDGNGVVRSACCARLLLSVRLDLCGMLRLRWMLRIVP